jgi:hypothetical protein
LATSGSQNIKPAGTGSYTLTMTCGRANGEHTDAKTTVTVTAAPSKSGPPPASGGGSGGGGGALGVDWLAVLGILLFGRRYARSSNPRKG